MKKYEKIYDYMLSRIKSGSYCPGDKFMTESELAKMFSTTHLTVRQAFKLLESKGYVVRERGRGTFVKSLSETAPYLSSSESKEIVYLSRDSSADFCSSLFRSFKLKNPDIKISFKNIFLDEHSEFLAKKSSPDTIYLYEFNDHHDLMDNNLMRPLDFLDSSKIADIDQNLILRMGGGKFGVPLAIPLHYVNRIHFMNAELARKSGLNPENPPQTWKELREWCEKAAGKGIKPLADQPEHLQFHFLYQQYLSLATANDPARINSKKLEIDFLIDTVVFFRDLRHDYALKPVENFDLKYKNSFFAGEYLFCLFAGPWFYYEKEVSGAGFDCVVMDKLVPSDNAPSFMYSNLTSLAMYCKSEKLNDHELMKLEKIFSYIASKSFQLKVMTSSEKYPTLSPHRLVQQKQIKSNPEMKSFYWNKSLPVLGQSIKSWHAWEMLKPEILNLWNYEINKDEFRQRVEWLQNRQTLSASEIPY